MIDFSGVKSITIPEGVVKQIQSTFGGESSNIIPTAIDTNGSIYNGIGYMDGYRMNSSGGLTQVSGYCHTGYIKYHVGDSIRIYSEVTSLTTGGLYVAAYDADFSLISVELLSTLEATGAILATLQDDGSYLLDWDTSKPTKWASAIYCRFSFNGSGSNLRIVTVRDYATVVLWTEPVSVKNWVPESIDTNGSVFNTTGYQDNMRVRSSGALGAVTGYVATGFIPVKPGDIVRFTCSAWSSNKVAANTINLGYISGGAFTSVGSYTTQPATYGIYTGATVTSENTPTEEKAGVVKFVVPNDSRITYLRLSCYGTGENLVVTINEEIT